MKTKIIKVVAFCLVLFLFLNYIYEVFSWKDTAGDYYSSVDALYELEDDLVDALFVGTSRCYCSINNAMLWDDFGISSFSMSISGQDIASSYHAIAEALKTQTPEVVCVEVHGTLFEGYPIDSNMYRNTLPYKLSLNSLSLIDEVGGDSKKDLIFKWPIIHTRYKELKREDFEENLPYLGYHCEFHVQEVGQLNTYEGDAREPIGENEEYWLREIIELVQEKNIQLCLFAAPFQCWEYDQMRLNYVQDIADEYQVKMVNMSLMQEELELNIQSDFIDFQHTNYWGAKKVTQYMGSLLTEEFHLADHRGDKNYHLWVENSQVRSHEYYNIFLQQAINVEMLFQRLEPMTDGYTIVIETNGDYYANGDALDSYMSMIGLEALCGTSGIWVIQDGERTLSLEGDAFGEYVDLGKGDMLLSRNEGISNIIIDDETYMRVWDGINVIVYDNLLGEVVDAIGFMMGYPDALIR
ncbi:MAG: hypothetical protein IJY10_10180 [Lachnospiraceae bacterium]|nr:hypothetical protein [Lachnospiraceae bacterium]